MVYVFDIDGTLTPFRDSIVEDFRDWFINWSKGKRIWFATGSDLGKTIEQLGNDFFKLAERSYQCNGQEIYAYGKLIHQADDFHLPEQCKIELERFLLASPFPVRAGNHLESRQGSMNFSVVGRDCSWEERKQYAEYDNVNKERKMIIDSISPYYPDLEFAVGGEISIDIYPKGSGKGQLVDAIDDTFTFFGDHLFPGGNDYSVYQRAVDLGIADTNFFHNVNGYEETWQILRGIK